jgi:hypothetical protein
MSYISSTFMHDDAGTHVEGGMTPEAATLDLVISAVFMQVVNPSVPHRQLHAQTT